MKHRNPKAVLALLLALVITASLFPLSAFAEEDTYNAVAKSIDGNTYYYSIDDAWNAAKSGTVIVMLKNWILKDGLVADEKNYIQIYMNGHRIDRNLSEREWDGEVIYLDENATLILYGYNEKAEKLNLDLYVNGWAGYEQREDVYLTGGGLVTGGWSWNGGGGIHMKDGARLFLSNVAVAGNKAETDYGGGICADGDHCYIMLNHSTVAYNTADYGGGINLEDENCTLELQFGSSIEHNTARSQGGGIYCDSYSETVELINGSYISYNSGTQGGAYFNKYGGNSITSPDKTGVMAYNKARGTISVAGKGGAVCLLNNESTGRNNSIEGITFEGNYAECYGGGIYCESMGDTTMKDCVIRSNRADKRGGGLYIDWSDFRIDNCTITGNISGEEGGGVFLCHEWNVTLRNRVAIKNNRRTDNSLDDLFLDRELTEKAYMIKTVLTSGSEIGVRTDTSSERLIGKDAQYDATMFFSDVSGFAVVTDNSQSDGSNELYLRNSGDVHSVSVNGKVQGYYAKGAKLTIDASSADPEAIFVEWEGNNFSLSQLDSTKNSVAAIASMPSENLAYTAKTVTPITSVSLTMGTPKAGELLPTSGTLVDQNGNDIPIDELYWLTQDEDGNLKTVTGTAEYGTKYCVAVMVEENQDKGILFDSEVEGIIRYNPGKTAGDVKKIYVNEEGTLFLYGDLLTTEKAVIASVESVSLTVKEGTTQAELLSQLPATAVVYDENGNAYTVNVNTAAADASAAVTNGIVNASGGTVTVPLSLTDSDKVENGTGENEKKLTVNVSVTEEAKVKTKLSVPTQSATDPAPDKNGNVSVTVTLSSETEGAKIYYRTANSEDYTKATGSITITAQPGERKIVTLQTYASAEGLNAYENSPVAVYTYVVDNPFTVTVQKSFDVAPTDSTLAKNYTAAYYKGDNVTVGAPVISGYTFEKWEMPANSDDGVSLSDDQMTANSFSVQKLERSICMVAVYKKNPEKETPSEEAETVYSFKIVYRVSGTKTELGSLDGMAAAGTLVTSVVTLPETITTDNGKVYNSPTMAEGTVTKNGSNIFYAYYTFLEERIPFTIVYQDEDTGTQIGSVKGAAKEGEDAAKLVTPSDTVKTDNGDTYVFSSLNKSCIVTKNGQNVFYAVYEKLIPYTIRYRVQSTGAVLDTYEDVAKAGSTVKLSRIAPEEITVNGTEYRLRSTDAQYTVTKNGTNVFDANYAADTVPTPSQSPYTPGILPWQTVAPTPTPTASPDAAGPSGLPQTGSDDSAGLLALLFASALLLTAVLTRVFTRRRGNR